MKKKKTAPKVKKKSSLEDSKYDFSNAKTVLHQQMSEAQKGNLNKKWLKKIQEFSDLCEAGGFKTHIAFLGTATLAKSIHSDIDLYAIKPTLDKKNSKAYSARTLCHNTLVPFAAEFGVDLGSSGREPLNNQPYFRMNKLTDDTPIHKKSRPAFNYMLSLIKELSELESTVEAKQTLAAFIHVRMKFQKKYELNNADVVVTPESLCKIIIDFVTIDSEGGRLAQAIVAGLVDVFAGEERVDSGRINDPSRRYPGDVCIRSEKVNSIIEKAFEVRDKPVKISDVHIFGKKCVDMNVREASVVMVSALQERLDKIKVSEWASQLGIGMTLFHGWSEFIEQVLFWSENSKPEAAIEAAKQIEKRLVQVEASEIAVKRWQQMITAKALA